VLRFCCAAAAADDDDDDDDAYQILSVPALVGKTKRSLKTKELCTKQQSKNSLMEIMQMC